MSGVNDIRSTFLDYFAKNGHQVLPSSPLVPQNDPTLMFTNAGMVQFKNVFTGLETRDYSRAATSQKCVRAGGKHNDLDNVGYTARHHTFFEMLGNFSFGDYFKEEAIKLAWDLITQEYALAKDRLLVTVYHTDDEAFDLWKKIAGFSDDRIIRIPTSDNFWAMGDTGPCGPCSEIFYDHGDKVWGGPPGSADEDGDRFIEIWNLVFMQFEQLTPEERVSLPRPSIDTGMGLERISALLQGKHNNYETDLFLNIIASTQDVLGEIQNEEQRASHRVIADHLRAASFLIADGVLPSNEGRGYVLRRIMRRAMRHGQLLGAREPVMYRFLPVLVQEMGRAFPELGRAESLIEETLKLEETRFRKTLSRGLDLLSSATDGMEAGATLAGETAFKLYDTYGFPLDLTQDALRRRDISVDTDAFNVAMEKQKAEARANWGGSGDAAESRIWFDVRDKVGATEFLGYELEEAEGQIAAIIVDGNAVDQAKSGMKVQLVLNQTPFYAESGGQQGDHGVINGADFTVEISDTVKRGDGLNVHIGTVINGHIKSGDDAKLVVDKKRRAALRANHSATHLLHEALRKTLGDHVAQKGSLVAPDRLRFDFSHQKAIDDGDMKSIEDIANAVVLQNTSVSTRLMAVDDAIEMGAQALFGEKYGDEVRVVSMGEDIASDLTKQEGIFSLELCGGTHVMSTGDIGAIKIIGESAVSSGVRRIEALTGTAARHYLNEQDALLREAASVLKSSPLDVPQRVASLMDERKKLERELAEAKKKLAMGGGDNGQAQGPKMVGDIALIAKAVTDIPAKELKGIVDAEKQKLGSGVVAIIATSEDGKGAAVVGVTEDLTSRVSAVDLVRAAAAALGGKGGGGRPDMAQAGGPDGAKASDALAAIEAKLATL